MVRLKKLELGDLEKYEYWKQPFHSYHYWNGPYFKKDTKEEIGIKMLSLRTDLASNLEINGRLIIVDELVVGEVSWYWKSKETRWLEVGIIVFEEELWNKGVGFMALELWIEQIFDEKRKIVRLGLSTWSGNNGMIKLAQKLGMRKEAEYRNARIVNGEYFDSVSYGILRSEWESKR